MTENPRAASGALPAAEDLEPAEHPALKRSGMALALLGGIGALEVLRSRFQASHVFLPQRYPEGVWDPRSHGVVAEDVWFSSEDGVELHGWWVHQPQARGTLLYCHGNRGSLGLRVEEVAFLSRFGLNLLAFDYRGYGRSAGSPSEKGLCRDVRAAHDQLTSAYAIEPRSIVLFGHSLGGAVAVDCAVHRPVGGLVVQSSFTHIKAMARNVFPQLPLHLLTRNQFRSIDKVAELAMPKLFLHGTGDVTVPIALGRELFERAAGPKDFYAVTDAGHNDIFALGGDPYGAAIRSFIDRCLTD